MGIYIEPATKYTEYKSASLNEYARSHRNDLKGFWQPPFVILQCDCPEKKYQIYVVPEINKLLIENGKLYSFTLERVLFLIMQRVYCCKLLGTITIDGHHMIPDGIAEQYRLSALKALQECGKKCGIFLTY